MFYDFDIIVIGSGLAGSTSAFKLHKQGKSVAIVEDNDFGGVGMNDGYTRKKELVTVADHIYLNHRFEKLNITQPLTLSWRDAMAWVNSLENKESQSHKARFVEKGITPTSGKAEFVDPHTIKVNNATDSAEKIIIAVGAKDRSLSIEGKQYLKTSRDFLTEADLPEKIVIVGAGIIGFAFASIAKSFGRDVTIIQHNYKVLNAFNDQLVNYLINDLRSRGVKIGFNEEISRIIPEGNQLRLFLKNNHELLTGAVYLAAGRIANIEDLKLDAIQVRYGDRGIVVNEYLQTSQPSIYALGDCNNQEVPKLGTYATLQADYLEQNLYQSVPKKIKYPIPAMSTFSQPRLAQCGVLVNEAYQKSNIYEVETIDMSEWLENEALDNRLAVLQIVTRKSDKKLVGIAALSDTADLLINYATMAITSEWTKQELRDMILAYPSMATDLSRFWSED